MAIPTAGSHTAPIVKVVTPMESVQQAKDVLVTITEDGSIVIGGDTQAHAKGLASVLAQLAGQ